MLMLIISEKLYDKLEDKIKKQIKSAVRALSSFKQIEIDPKHKIKIIEILKLIP